MPPTITRAPTAEPPSSPVVADRAARPAHSSAGWFEERLGLRAFQQKFGRKAFPVHSTFFLGEMALFSFLILVLTGMYLGLIYSPSNVEVTYDGERLPQAYASVRLIESIPIANVIRSVHHWAAHLMIASTALHLLRIFFSGSYRKPREINWVIGVVLLVLTLVAGFVGYALPYDAFAVTATDIGYSLARSIPWVGRAVADLFFGGVFPTLGSLPRLYTLHVAVVPALLTAVMALHLVIVLKQKHSQPGYARRLSEPGRVLGVPMWPYQALAAGQLMLLMLGGLFLLSAYVPAHPLEAYGPPGPETPAVKPDWYLLWVYGFLKLVPSGAVIALPGATIGPEFLGGVLFPALVFGVITLAPWLDRTNRRAVRRFEYLEPPRQSPFRLAIGVGLVTYIGTLMAAAYHDEIGLDLTTTWLLTLAVPVLIGAALYTWASRTAPNRESRVDPTAE